MEAVREGIKLAAKDASELDCFLSSSVKSSVSKQNSSSVTNASYSFREIRETNELSESSWTSRRRTDLVCLRETSSHWNSSSSSYLN